MKPANEMTIPELLLSLARVEEPVRDWYIASDNTVNYLEYDKSGDPDIHEYKCDDTNIGPIWRRECKAIVMQMQYEQPYEASLEDFLRITSEGLESQLRAIVETMQADGRIK